MKRTWICLVVVIWGTLMTSQKIKAQVSQNSHLLSINKINERIEIDGNLDEGGWRSAATADSFINKWPNDSGQARLQTIVKIAYDDQFIYFGIKAILGDKPVVLQSLKRDENPYYSDGVSVVLDPSGKNTSGYTFGVNAGGAQMDGIVEINTVSFDWDTKWYSATTMNAGFWTAELAIPFKSFRFPNAQTQWGINFIRNDMTNNSFSTWNQVPIQFIGSNLYCLGKISFCGDLPSVKSNNVIIPYLSSKAQQQLNNVSLSANVGFDTKIALNSSLNLDLTVNPDFSPVDVDRQIINLDRFNILLPERRTFFLENGDLFENFGLANLATPFVSRSIGLTVDGRVVPIIAGLRLTGNVNPSLRIGLMNIQSAEKYGLPAQNYTVGAFDQKVSKRSNLRGIVTNRQEITGAHQKGTEFNYNRVAGTEYDFVLYNTGFYGRAGYYYSFNPEHPNAAGFGLASIGYTDKHISGTIGWNQVNSNFIADLGFTPRLYNVNALSDSVVRIGYHAYTSTLDYLLYPKSKKAINSVDYFVKTNHYYTVDNKFIEFNGTTGMDILFANRREALISWMQDNVFLPFPTVLFPETGILASGKYNFGYIQLEYLSNFLKPFSWGLTFQKGGYYNGKRTTYIGNLKYRAQPWGNFGVDFTYNEITLNGVKINPLIFGPTIEFTFSNTLFWTTFLQYNSQIKNFNVNSRLQWRFKPLSDLFLVYTDNYFTEGLMSKGRSLVLKINYWIN